MTLATANGRHSDPSPARHIEHPEVEGKTRLRGVQLVLQLADATFPAPEHLKDHSRVASDSARKSATGTVEVSDGEGRGRQDIVLHQ